MFHASRTRKGSSKFTCSPLSCQGEFDIEEGKGMDSYREELQDFGFATCLHYRTMLFESSITYMIVNRIAKCCLPKLQIADGK